LSDDFGKSRTNPQQAPIRFPSDTGVSLKNIWQIAVGRPEEPNLLYCGVEPAALFATRDAGETWSLLRELFDLPHRPRWMPRVGGLDLHSILLDAADNQQMYAAAPLPCRMAGFKRFASSINAPWEADFSFSSPPAHTSEHSICRIGFVSPTKGARFWHILPKELGVEFGVCSEDDYWNVSPLQTCDGPGRIRDPPVMKNAIPKLAQHGASQLSHNLESVQESGCANAI
jgi:hypothetical protein